MKNDLPLNALNGEEAWEQLMVLRGLTKTTGVMHEAQVLQLKMWSLACSPHVRSSEIHVNFDKHEIEFHLKTKGKIPEDIKLRYESLVKCVQWLLGEEWLVRIKVKDRLVYRGVRKVHNVRGRQAI